MNNWLYKGKEIKTMPEGEFGFVYVITHNPSGRKYIGRKNFLFRQNKKLGKKERNILIEERKKKKMRGRVPSKKLVIKESDWQNYWGSNKKLQQLVKSEGAGNFTKEILEFGFNKKHLTYLETQHLFKNNVLENEEYFNDNILSKFFTKDLDF